MKKYLLILGSFWLLMGCESLKQEVDPGKLNEEVQKLVVACFISPQDTLLTADVRLSRPVLGENIGYNDRVDNATLTLSDENRSAVFERRSGQYQGQYYYAIDPKNFPIVAGRRYTLTVQIPDGRKVEAHCTVPAPVVADRIVFDSIPTFKNGFSGTDYFVRLYWQDPAGQPNFYRVAGTFSYLSKRPDYPNAPEPSWAQNLLDFRRNEDTRDLVDDRQRDGEVLGSSRGFVSLYGGNPQGAFQYLDKATITVDLLHVDANYFQYHQAVQQQSQASGNPFAEPVLVPGNIQGGLGCFGAYNRTQLSVDLK
ncbi:DUF4249 domain-containing protein [Larkinella sp. VNQ87]|uniref:DUF4249 domain-containing protein n=1 Tax=Larkinella sp. VNQ87 TaxID=3400921 RepID=UPI003C087F6A